MSDTSAAELEREAEDARARLADTAESLREKMSPGQLIDEVTNYFVHSDGALAFGNLKTQIRDNPLPLALVGVGLAWLFMGGGPSASSFRRHRREHVSAADYRSGYGPYGDGDWEESDWDDTFEDQAGEFAARGRRADWESDTRDMFADTARWAEGTPDPSLQGDAEKRDMSVLAGETGSGSSSSGIAGTARSMASGIAGAASSAGEAVAGAAGTARESVAGVGRQAYRAGRRLNKGSRRAGQMARRTFLDVLDQEPLVLGALGIAVGAAIGAMLPSTEIENEYLGAQRDRLRDAAGERLREGMEEAREVASTVYESAKSEADRQGLMPGDTSLAERVGEVAKAAVGTAESEARAKLDGDTATGKKTT